MTADLVLERAAYETIMSHAARAYPEECCGAIAGQVDGSQRIVRHAWPVENATAESRSNRYTIAPADYLRLERRARESGIALIGFYHSHPDAPSRPSSFDLAHAWPGFSYVIVSVEATVPQVLTSWRLREDRSGFDSEEMTWQHAS